MKKLAIFDLDGTILETLEDLYRSVDYALTKNNLPTRTKSEVRAFVGNGIRNLMIRSCPEGADEKVVDKVHETFLSHYKVHKADNTAPYEGIQSLLYNLKKKGYLLAVASNKDDGAVKELCKKFFPDLFDVELGNCPDITRKPAPDALFYIMDTLGVDAKNTVYVGDSEVDILTAQNANIPCITVLWGFRDKDYLLSVGAKTCAETVIELENLL